MNTTTSTRNVFGVVIFSTGRVHAEAVDGGLLCGGRGGEGLRFSLMSAEDMGAHFDRVPLPCTRCAAALRS